MNTTETKLEWALNYLDILREYMIDRDTQAAIDREAFYLAALGLSTYTEILGGLYCGDLKTNLGQHYICFINEFFHSDYMKVDHNLRMDNLKGLYGAVRSGLAHEYFIKQSSKIEKDSAIIVVVLLLSLPRTEHLLGHYCL
jgi:hypothetical protein